MIFVIQIVQKFLHLFLSIMRLTLWSKAKVHGDLIFLGLRLDSMLVSSLSLTVSSIIVPIFLSAIDPLVSSLLLVLIFRRHER